jgi:electron transport complex protein RnfG
VSEAAPTPAVERPEVSSFRLVATLALAGALAGLLLVFVDQATAPAIAAYKAEELRKAVKEVLKEPASYDTLYLVEGKLTPEAPADGASADVVYAGYDAEGNRVGFAMAHREAGFQDFIELIFGYDAKSNALLGMKILESKETPGLGDKIFLDDDFVDQFTRGVETPLEPVKKGEATEENRKDVETITGATISSKAVIQIINNALKRWKPHIEAYEHQR